MKKYFLLVTAVFTIIIFSCREENFNNDTDFFLTLSTDTIMFDTVFTTIGSVTKQLRIYNNGNSPVVISRIYLAGGQNSFFKINVDGDQTRDITDIEIRAKDSLYIFVQVTIDPFGVNNPMVVNDSIVFITNGNTQDVNLVAYGQDMHLINGEWIKSTTWQPDKPYLIYNYMAIDSTETLTIEAGTKLYFHKGSALYVLGKILVNGTKENPVIFRGDRLDYFLNEVPYDRKPGQWDGIVIYPNSTGNIFNYCYIRNSIFGILAAGDLNEKYHAEVTIKNSILDNFSYAALMLYNARLILQNSQISNAVSYLLGAPVGGELSIHNCTFANYIFHSEGSYRRSGEPSVLISNQFATYSSTTGKDTIIKGDLRNAEFINCILYGSLDNELKLYDNKVQQFNYKFDHSIVKTPRDSVDADNPERFNQVSFTGDPKFKHLPKSDDYFTNKFYYDFSLDTLSSAKDSAQREIITQFPELEFDLKGNSRLLDIAPDIGAYERIE